MRKPTWPETSAYGGAGLAVGTVVGLIFGVTLTRTKENIGFAIAFCGALGTFIGLISYWRFTLLERRFEPPGEQSIESKVFRKALLRTQNAVRQIQNAALGANADVYIEPRPLPTVARSAIPRHPEGGLPSDHEFEFSSIRTFADQIKGIVFLTGPAASGKSVWIREICDTQIKYALQTPEAAVPLFGELAAWEPGDTDLIAYLIRRRGVELNALTPSLVRHLLSQDRLLILLDGLDEVKPEAIGQCTAAIENFAKVQKLSGRATRVLITSRSHAANEISRAESALIGSIESLLANANNVFEMQPVSNPNIELVLREVDAPPSVIACLETNSDFQLLLSSPLWFNLFRIAMVHMDDRQLASFLNASPVAMQQTLSTMLFAEQSRYPNANLMYRTYLQRLATGMDRNNQVVFQLSDLKLDWLERKSVRLIARGLAASLSGILAALAMVPAFIAISANSEGRLFPLQFIWIGPVVLVTSEMFSTFRALRYPVDLPSRFASGLGWLFNVRHLASLTAVLARSALLRSGKTALYGATPAIAIYIYVYGWDLSVAIILLLGVFVMWMLVLVCDQIIRDGRYGASASVLVTSRLGMGVRTYLEEIFLRMALGAGFVSLIMLVWNTTASAWSLPLSLLDGNYAFALCYGASIGAISLVIFEVPEFVVTLSCLLAAVVTGQAPLNFQRFLSHCVANGLLYQCGSGYRFPHRTLQAYIAGGDEPNPDPRPVDYEILTAVAIRRSRVGDSHGAVQFFERAHTIKPIPAYAVIDFASSLVSLGRESQALELYDLYLAKEGNRDRVRALLTNKALVLLEQRKLAEATYVFRHAVSVQPSEAKTAYFYLAAAYWKIGDRTMANRMFRRCIGTFSQTVSVEGALMMNAVSALFVGKPNLAKAESARLVELAGLIEPSQFDEFEDFFSMDTVPGLRALISFLTGGRSYA